MHAMSSVVVILVVIALSDHVYGHGRLIDPPSRSSMWRFGFGTEVNFNDNELFCGGFAHQTRHGGKCGLCGDPYEQNPRDNEAGGKYASGIISKSYKIGSIIAITVEVTANHFGYFEFRLCENNNVHKKITKECLMKHLLVNPDSGKTQYYIGETKGHIHVKVRLPTGVTCTQCVLQWRYHTANSWGWNEDDDDDAGCIGCGPQEEFYGCSDIAIIGSFDKVPPTAAPIPTTAKPPITTTKSTPKPVTTTKAPPPTTKAPPSTTKAPPPTTKAPPRTTKAPPPTTKAPPHTTKAPPHTTTEHDIQFCIGISARLDDWCFLNCNHVPPFCPHNYCVCL